jgi:hypothetical protein
MPLSCPCTPDYECHIKNSLGHVRLLENAAEKHEKQPPQQFYIPLILNALYFFSNAGKRLAPPVLW